MYHDMKHSFQRNAYALALNEDDENVTFSKERKGKGMKA